ncbi:MAG: sensor histidine kinase [Bryobacteraceae bacterium]
MVSLTTLPRDRVAESPGVKFEGSRDGLPLMADFCNQVRVPIDGLLGMMDLMLEIADGELREHLLTTRLCARELAEKVNAALEFSRLNGRKRRPLLTPFDLCETIEAVVSGQAERAQSRHIELYCHFPDTLPPIVEGPLGDLRQALSLLLAILIAETGDGEVGVSTTHIRGPSGILLSVKLSSTDACLAPEQLDHFRLLLNNGGRDMAPRSLELLMTSRILQGIGAEVEVQAGEPTGLSFEVTAPLAIPGSMPEPGELEWDQRLKGRSAVVLSANTRVADAIRGLLHQFGLRVDRSAVVDEVRSPWVVLVDTDSCSDLPDACHDTSHRISFGRRRADGTPRPDLEKPVRRYVLYDLLLSLLTPDRDRRSSGSLPACNLIMG